MAYCQQCPGICSSHGTCLSTAVQPTAMETPYWDEFVGMNLWWPSLVQIVVTVFFSLLRPIYSKMRDNNARFRIFLQRFIGMPDKRKVTCTWPLIIIQILRLGCAMVQCAIFAYKTYAKGQWNANDIADWDLAISCYFIFTHLLERLSEGFELRFWNPKALVDVYVITPMLIPYGLDAELVPVERRWLSLSYFRIITALGSFRNIQRLFRLSSQQGDTVLGRCVLTMLRLTAMIVCMAGTMFVLEVLGEIPGLEDTFLTVGMGDLSIVQMIYWITTTISTVGYGDFSPTTVPSRIMIIFFIFGGVIFFGAETAEIVEIFNETEEGRGSYVASGWKLWRGNRKVRTQIVITGNGCHMSSPLMETLLLETLSETDDQCPDLVFLSDKEYDFDLKAFVETELGPGQAEKVFFLRGSVLNARDLERAQIQTSRLCFVVPDHTAEDAFQEDSANIMMSLSMLRHSPKLRLRLMLLLPEGTLRANKMGIPRERCFSAEEMKCALFAQSTRIRGLITFLSGLLQVHTNFTDQHLRFLRKKFPEHWRIPYSESLRWNINGLLLRDCYGNRSFASVLCEIYRESRGTVMLVAAVHRGRLMVNYDKVLEPGQVVVVFSQGQKAFARFAKETDAFEFDKEWTNQWTDQFLKERAKRLENEAYQTFQDLKRKDTMDLKQQGLRQKHLRDGEHKTKSIFEVTGAEAFKLLDKNNDGRLDKEEFEKALQEQLAADLSNVADIEELRESRELTLLLVRDCQGMWQLVDCFLQQFLEDQLYKSLLPKPPVVVLSDMVAPKEVILKWESKTCCFMKGNILNTANLEGAGIRNAANIISIGRKVFSKDSNLPDAALGDSDCVELCGAVEQALQDNNRDVGRGQLQLFEFSFTRSVFLMSRVDRDSVAMGRDSRLFSSEASGVTSANSRVMEDMDPIKVGLDKELLILNESFAAGQAFTLDFFGGLFGRIHQFPAAIEFLDAIANPTTRGQTSRIWQTACPSAWVDRTFGELVQALVMGEDREAFGNFTGCCIPVALYRENRRRFLPPGCAGFNCTLPPMHTRLEADDFITIIGDMSFGTVAHKAGLFDQVAPRKEELEPVKESTIEMLRNQALNL